MSENNFELFLIAAVSENRVIGNKEDIPWDVTEHFTRFKKMTKERAVIMGRNTFDYILHKKREILNARVKVVLTRDLKFQYNYVHVAHNLEEALRIAECYRDMAYVMGGQQIYEQTINLPQTKRLEITEVKGNYKGDAFFPKIKPNIWKQTEREERNGFDYVSYERKHV